MEQKIFDPDDEAYINTHPRHSVLLAEGFNSKK